MDWKKFVTENYEEISKYPCLGLRGLQADEQYKIGDTSRNSYDWDFENDCSSEDELNGTCAVQINTMFVADCEDLISEIEETISFAEDYSERIVLLGGYSETQGDDGSERIIENAKVLAIIK